MIQNIIILYDGIALVNENFGECHKLDSNPILLASFFEAIHKFAFEFKQGILEQMKFRNANVNYMKNKNIIYIIISDSKDRLPMLKTKLKRVAQLFEEKYRSELQNFNGEITTFKGFRADILESEIASVNCGDHTNCSECQNRFKTSKVFNEVINKK